MCVEIEFSITLVFSVIVSRNGGNHKFHLVLVHFLPGSTLFCGSNSCGSGYLPYTELVKFMC